MSSYLMILQMKEYCMELGLSSLIVKHLMVSSFSPKLIGQVYTFSHTNSYEE